jgi:hypothetical protein
MRVRKLLGDFARREARGEVLLGAGFDHLVRQVAGGGLALARVGDAGDVRGQRVADGVSAVPVRVVCHARGAPSPVM